MRQLILVEDFKNGLTAVMTTYINEETADTLQKAATLTDEFILTQMSRLMRNHEKRLLRKKIRFVRNVLSQLLTGFFLL